MDFATSSKLAQTFLSKLQEPFVGRHEEALVITLSILSREHAVLIGEPGTGKSAIARRAASLINARFFKYLLTKFTEPSELFGPLDIKKLREGQYVRITKGKLPETEIAFLDEIFNANSAVLNSLLSIMQERILYDGYNEIRVPLWTVIGASNRIPEEPELEALYDRFLYRIHVKPLDQDYWEQLLDAAWKIELGLSDNPRPVMTLEQVNQIYKHVMSVDLNMIKPSFIKLLLTLENKGIHVTDRRKGKILKAIAAHALLSGRKTANETDLIVLKYTVPRYPDDFEKINVILVEELRTKERVLRELEEIRANIESARRVIARLHSFDPKLIDYMRNLKAAKTRVAALVKDFDDPEVVGMAEDIINTIDMMIEEVMAKMNM